MTRAAPFTAARRRVRALAVCFVMAANAAFAPAAPAPAPAAPAPAPAPAPALAAPTPAPSCPPPAEPPTDEQVQAGLREARDRGFLWRIDKGGHSSYLYGTLHVAARAWMFPGPRVVRALNESDTLALELDLLDPQVQQRMARATEAQPRVTLPRALEARLQRRMDAECLPPGALAPLGPELQIATLSMLAGRREGLEPSFGIDAFLAGFGRSLGKQVVSLETPEAQLDALRTGDRAALLDAVGRGLDDLERGRAGTQLRRVARVWADSDDAALASYERWCDCVRTAADRASARRLLDDRNPGLAAAIDALHAGGTRVFAAVGSLHMVGPTGLPTLLARRGYRVERIAYAPK